jgi:hypothetical protein
MEIALFMDNQPNQCSLFYDCNIVFALSNLRNPEYNFGRGLLYLRRVGSGVPLNIVLNHMFSGKGVRRFPHVL